jgi:hypothetical protein
MLFVWGRGERFSGFVWHRVRHLVLLAAGGLRASGINTTVGPVGPAALGMLEHPCTAIAPQVVL